MNDDRNALRRALDETAGWPESQEYAIPEEAVCTGFRRLRARRTGAAIGLAALAVAAIAGGAYGLASGEAPATAGPSPDGSTTTTASAGTWPAQFARCGADAVDVLPDTGPMTLRPYELPAAMPADGTWATSLVVDIPTADFTTEAVLHSTDLLVVRAGIVVGVQDGGPPAGFVAPGPPGVAGPLPLVTRVTLTLASCDRYFDEKGASLLPPGTHDLVVKQEIGYGVGGDLSRTARASFAATVEITEPAGLATHVEATPAGVTDPTVCGTSVDALAWLSQEVNNFAPFRLVGTPHSAPPDGSGYAVTAALTNTGTGTVQGSTSTLTAVLVRDGAVVGVSDVGGPFDLGTLAPFDTTAGYPDPPEAERCPGVEAPTWAGSGMPPGGYELWFVAHVSVTAPDPAEWTVTGGPHLVTVPDLPWRETFTGDVPSAWAVSPVRAVFRCGVPVVTAAAADGEGLALVADKHIALDGVTLAPGGGAGPWGPLPTEWNDAVATGLVSVHDGKEHVATVSETLKLALTDSHGNVVRLAAGWFEDHDLQTMTLRRLAPSATSGVVASGWLDMRCPSFGDDWILADAVDLPAGTYTVWPYVLVDEGHGPEVLLGQTYPITLGPPTGSTR